MAHHTYPALPKDHIKKEAGRAFASSVLDPNIKIQLPLRGEKIVSEAFRQTLKLQAMFLGARPWKMNARTFCGSWSAPPNEGTTDNLNACAVRGTANFEEITTMKQRKKMMTDAGNKTSDHGVTNTSQQGHCGSQETNGSQHKVMTNPQKVSGCQQKSWMLTYTLRPLPPHIKSHNREGQK